MSKKNRAKSKAKRFGEGSAKPIVSAATYGVGGNAFAQAIADPVSTVHSNKPELLVVDGYNVIHCTPRYEKLRGGARGRFAVVPVGSACRRCLGSS